MKNLALRATDVALVIAHNDVAPSDAEWEQVLAAIRAARDRDALRVLVFTEGAVPNTLQRDGLNKTFGGATPRIAVVSGARLVRTVGAALSWFNPRFKVFNPEELEAAFAHLEVSSDARRVLESAADEVRREVGTQPAAARRR